MNRPKISLNDPRNTNSPRKTILAARVEAAMELEAELSVKSIVKEANNVLKKVSAIHFEEKKHPRDPKGKFAKSSSSKSSNATTDIRSKVIVDGDQGFKDILMGLALGAIAEVMDVPENMSKITVHQSDLHETDAASLGKVPANGVYDPSSKEIGIDTTSSEGRSFTAIHEIGHWLDYNLKGQHLTDNKKLMDSINNSSIIKLFRSFPDRPDATDQLKREVKYLVTPTEMFARAFSQWVATRSSNPTLKKELKDRQALELTQWEPKDFEPIGREFDRIFKPKNQRR